MTMTTTERLIPCPHCLGNDGWHAAGCPKSTPPSPAEAPADVREVAEKLLEDWRHDLPNSFNDLVAAVADDLHTREVDRRAAPAKAVAPAELLQLHRDAVNTCVSWKLGEVAEDDAAKVEAAFREALSRAIEPREKRELRLIKDCEELTEVIAALQAEAQAVAPADVREVAEKLVVDWYGGSDECLRSFIDGYGQSLIDAIASALTAQRAAEREECVKRAEAAYEEAGISMLAEAKDAIRSIHSDDGESK